MSTSIIGTSDEGHVRQRRDGEVGEVKGDRSIVPAGGGKRHEQAGNLNTASNGNNMELVWSGAEHGGAKNSSKEQRSGISNNQFELEESNGHFEQRETPKLHGRKILEFMCMSGRDNGLIGIKKFNGKKLNDLNLKNRGHVVRIVKKIVMRVCQSFLPLDSRTLLCAVSNELGVKNDLIEHLVSLLRVYKLRSLEKRMMRALIIGIVEGNEAKRLIAVDTSYSVYEDSESSSDGDEDSGGRGEDAGRTGDDGNRQEGHGGDAFIASMSDGRDPRLRERMMCGGSRRFYKRAEEDWLHFKEQGFIAVPRRRNKKITDESVEESLREVLSRKNRQLLASGTKFHYTQDMERIVLPQIRRTRSRTAIVRDYHAMKENNRNNPRVGRATLMKMFSALTSGQQEMKNCVDYCLGVLVFENVRSLKYIIKKRVQDVGIKSALLDQVTAVSNLLKQGYTTHFDSDEDVAHNSKRALVGTTMEVEDPDTVVSASTDTKFQTKCMECLKPFQVIDNIRAYVNEGYDGVREVLDDSANKFKLFLRHQLRCHVQRKAFEDAEKELLSGVAGQMAIVVIDFKMKFEPRKYRQKSSDWYGRKGLSWHGAVIVYNAASEDCGIELSEGKAVVKNIYLDHVCRNDTNQTAYQVCSILELICRQLRLQLPSLKRIILQSDNTANYNNKLFPVMAPFICKRNGFVLDRILHSETQDGNGRVDTHFATASRAVDKYIAENGLNVVITADLVRAINHGDGMPSCIGELYDMDNYCDEAKMWMTEMKAGQGNGGLANLGRVNEVRYRSSGNVEDSFIAETYVFKYSKPLTWLLEVGKSTSREGVKPDEDEDGSDCDAQDEDEPDDLTEIRDIVSTVESPALYSGPMTRVRLIRSGFVKRTSMAVKDINDGKTTGGAWRRQKCCRGEARTKRERAEAQSKIPPKRSFEK